MSAGHISSVLAFCARRIVDSRHAITIRDDQCVRSRGELFLFGIELIEDVFMRRLIFLPRAFFSLREQ
ncbi:hypothetical protein BRX37_21285 [Sphingomonas sp. S-NIH.Pt3_0716]|nr:hypothetical protein BRX37_21285 [Sphingomonas sp. S-NIH.Pt3_0716]